ncbi:hypothetical protein [Acidithiobacillus ferriphilus]|nr:hypothetical protein [Acidithiobacillus ferriphilus]EGQ63870.1 hypothetical protein GGI1_22124 [Acidithiobacillus sp. GGI-221]MBU2829975.1 hypothetical protein [Acidithiobacillus ferriphilus]WCE94324.1 hypothetical protein PJU76_01920 [Acidithiobacillus ferriphilus]
MAFLRMRYVYRIFGAFRKKRNNGVAAAAGSDHPDAFIGRASTGTPIQIK